MNFWENVFRYPRFLVSSCVGLVLVILSPLRQFTKTRFSIFLIILLLVLLVTFLTVTLNLMLTAE